MSRPFVPEQAEYSSHWSSNAGHFAGQGCYTWMAERLSPLMPKKVLDIGCGTGEGMLALLAAFSPSIVAVEENAECMRICSERLTAAGHKPTHLLRHSYVLANEGRYGFHVDPSPIRILGAPFLVQGDVLLNDPALREFLDQQAPFDAVTVWLIGAYMFRQNCLNLAPSMITNGNEYRLRVQNQVYELAARVLRPGGWLQVVDRGEAPREKYLLDDLTKSHRDQAATTDLEVFDVSFRGYDEPTKRGVSMVASPGSSGRIPSAFELAMISVLSRKPEPK